MKSFLQRLSSSPIIHGARRATLRPYSQKVSPSPIMSLPSASDVESLRTLSAATFAGRDFRNVRWAGVFGSLACGKQTDRSDVHVIVYRKRADKERSLNPDFLEDVLPRAWNRAVDVVYVKDTEAGFQYQGYVAIEALLCSPSPLEYLGREVDKFVFSAGCDPRWKQASPRAQSRRTLRGLMRYAVDHRGFY